MAKLYYRYGAMNCGKTTHLLQVAHNYEEQKMKVLIMKPSIDTKGGKRIVSRLGISKEVDHLISKDEHLYEYITSIKNLKKIKCIFVDEAQFLNKKQVDDLMKIVIYNNIPVICYGIRLDFQGNGFPGSTRLLEIAHSIEELKTICKCGKKAMYNARYVNNVFTIEGNQVGIDDKDEITYKPLCPKCFYEEIDKLN